MELFHKDFEKESLQTGDFFAIFGIDEEMVKNGSVKTEKVTDKEKIIINRSKTKALLIAEEMNAEITIKEDDNEMQIIIVRKI